MSWHADTTLIARYADGTLDQANASSVEAHLLSCEQCRAIAARRVDHDRLDTIFEGVRDAIDRPRARLFERLLTVLGFREHVARLITATPALTASWFIAVAIALTWGVVVARTQGEGVATFLVFAPLIPLAGVALSFGPQLDPTYEVGVAAPLPGFRLFLLRAGTVLVTSIALVGVASFALPDIGWRAAAWLLPALAVTFASAALSTWLSPLPSASIVAAAWLAIVIVDRTGSRWNLSALDVFAAGGQIGAAVMAVIALVIVAARAGRFDAGSEA